MDRRTFLKRTGAGAAAACAALGWRAPEKPPEYGPLEIDLTPFHPEPGQEPYWWAECTIEGRSHRCESVTSSTFTETLETTELGGAFDNVVEDVARRERDVEVVLWGEHGRFLHVVDLVKERRLVQIALHFPPDRMAPGRLIRLDGRFIGVSEPNDNHNVPAFEATVRMTGIPEWRG